MPEKKGQSISSLFFLLSLRLLVFVCVCVVETENGMALFASWLLEGTLAHSLKRYLDPKIDCSLFTTRLTARAR